MTLVRTYDVASRPHGMLPHLKGLLGYPLLVWQNRYMLQNFLRRDLMSRVNESVLGIGWLLLQPLFLFAVYFLVFGVFLGSRAGGGPDLAFAIYLFSGVVVFHAITEATSVSCSLIVDNSNLVKKVAFPSEVLPVHVSLVALVIYLVGAAVVFVAGWATGVTQPGWRLLALPLVLLVQFLFTLGLGMLLANLNVFVRDTAQVWRLTAMAWMFLSPVFLRTEQLLEALGPGPVWWMEVLNPAWALIQAHRLTLGGVDPGLGEFWPQVGTAAAWSAAFLLLGYTMFMSRKHKYADLI